MASETFDSLLTSLKKTAAALRDAGIPFAVGGGLATWAWGGPATEHDVDIMVKEEDGRRAQAALEAAGMRPADPPEDWLLKAWDGDTLVDLIFRPSGMPITDEVLDRAPVTPVEAMQMPVLLPGDVLVTKLLSLTEHQLDYSSVLEVSRSLREQIDWEDVRDRTKKSPFARAFFFLAEELGVIPSRG
jgi:hypothetical protein